MMRQIAAEVPAGSSQAQIFAYLREEDADFGEAHPAFDFDLRKEKLPPGTQVVTAIFRNTGYVLFGRAHMQAYFILAKDGTLDRVVVDETFDSFP